MTLAPPPPKKSSWLHRLFKRLVLAVFGVSLVAASAYTPLFATVIGGTLSIIGDWYGHDDSPPQAYVILGGGLTNTGKLIRLNAYSYERTQTLWRAWQRAPLPVILSGVESPWINDALAYMARQADSQSPSTISENASMNTCENARFTAKLIAHDSQEGTLPPIHHVYLVSDWYHMARARRQFAKAGIATTPLSAPMPSGLSWTDGASNLNHSRRALYEVAALIRDIVRPQSNCRLADNVSIKIIKTPRKHAKTF